MRVCFTGGGTAGHVFPAFPVDTELARILGESGLMYERFWIGTHSDQERSWVLGAGIEHHAVASGKLRRYFSWRFFADMAGIVTGLFQSVAILRANRPDVMFSKGGYASVPPVLAARLLGIPAVTHESDAVAGLATRINARVVTTVCIPFEEVRQTLPRKSFGKAVVTGIPSRFSRERADGSRAREAIGIVGNVPLIVILGGSQGALQINEMIWERLEELTELGFVFHQTGRATYRPVEREGYRAVPFVDEGMEDLLDAATIVVSRSGATALAELIEMGKPMVLIPLGLDASRGDQIKNARRMERLGAAVVLEGGRANGAAVVDAIRMLLHDERRRQEMVKRLIPLRTEDAGRRIADAILRAAAEGKA